MDQKKTLIAIFVASLLIFSGCQVLSNLWPTPVSDQALRYIGTEPNSVCFYKKNLGFATNVKQTALDLYISTEEELLYRSNLNKERYRIAMAYLDLSIQQAKSEQTSMIGTLNQPGWLLSSLIALLPVGTYLAGYNTQRPQDYSESEMQAKISENKNQSV